MNTTAEKTTFPFENYKRAIEMEGAATNVGADAKVLAAARDPKTGMWRLKVAIAAMPTGCDFDGGDISQRNEGGQVVFSGNIVSCATDAGIVAVEADDGKSPVVGKMAKLSPPDYLKALRKFVYRLDGKPAEMEKCFDRFMGLRRCLLSESTPLDHWDGNKYMRPSQCLAACNAMERDFSFIWGPPGTGKSYTLGHIAAELVRRGNRVLVLSNTNSAVDTLAFAIDDAFKCVGRPLADGRLVRYTPTLSHRDEYARRPHLTAYTRLLNEFERKKASVKADIDKCRDMMELVDRGSGQYGRLASDLSSLERSLDEIDKCRMEAVKKMLSRAKVLCVSAASCIFSEFQHTGFDAVLVDEASQMPLAVWPCLMAGENRPKFVVAGDPMQLMPVDAKSNDPAAHFWFSNNIYSILHMTEYTSIEPFIDTGSVALLTEQTRMRRGICEAVSGAFYNGLVKGDRESPRLDWLELPGLPHADIAIVDTNGVGDAFRANAGSSAPLRNTNATSAETAMRLLARIVEGMPHDQRVSVAIITPFRNQANTVYPFLLREFSRRGNLSIECSTIHRSQGSEADVVIIDPVNPLSPFLNKDDASHLWCVACSRAKERLIIVGDAKPIRTGRFSGRIFRHAEVVGAGA